MNRRNFLKFSAGLSALALFPFAISHPKTVRADYLTDTDNWYLVETSAYSVLLADWRVVYGSG